MKNDKSDNGRTKPWFEFSNLIWNFKIVNVTQKSIILIAKYMEIDQDLQLVRQNSNFQFIEQLKN